MGTREPDTGGTGMLRAALERRPYLRHLVWVAVAVLGSVVVANQLNTGRDDPWVDAGPLIELRAAGVTYVDGVFVVAREGEDPIALSEDANHIEGEAVRYCPSSGWFESAFHGEKFDGLGIYRDGPASADLDTVALRIEDGRVLVNPSQVTAGTARGERGPGEEPAGAFCVGTETEGPGPGSPGFFAD